ncbi:TetR/AcrR family transcriptional regulator [Shewanella sp. KX20019]|uniref:TetR/AcrR family transcriptional regulator n=1 Tax=Shewanella sp. KX20019 TaxID=2803864 RepID=UPI001927E2EA|nr:TetR/AcrR family transcriptional regulator [Shewanella sp. KX20019]QQX80880.1 TetR/AcrR family transcriptional regulator [Shewanella sp. KX20019]
MHNYLKEKSVIRDRILVEAKRLIVEEGVCSFRLSKLPTRSKCSPNTFYSHFKSREDIVVALFVEHVNDILIKIDVLMDMDELSNREKIVFILMYDIIKCWSAEEGDVCINFLGVNPHIYGFSSSEYEGNINVIFIELKERVQELWSRSVRSGEIVSSKKDIVACIFSLTTVGRGSIAVGQNKFLRQHGHDNNGQDNRVETLFNLLCLILNTLQWENVQIVSYSKMLDTLTPLVSTAAGTVFRHCRLNYETLSEPIEL